MLHCAASQNGNGSGAKLKEARALYSPMGRPDISPAMETQKMSMMCCR